tara:strand:+ start:2151 stop:3611 length:1461 start_codon:yes stop_codon:yes gene_type:complete
LKNSYNKTAFDTLTNAWADLILMPLLFIRMPILTKNLAPEEYGLWGLVFTTCSLSLTLTSLGLGSALSRFLPSNKSKENIQEGFYSVLIIKTLLSLFLSISFFVLSQIFISDFDNNSELVKITSLLILLTTIQPVYSRLLKIFRKIKTLSTLKIIEGYGLVILYASILLNGYGLIHLLYSYLLVKTGIIIFLIIYLWPKTGIKWPKFTLLKEYFSYGLPTLPSSISFWIVNLSDRYIIVYLLGASSLGIYSAAYVIGSIPHMVSSLINFIMLVALSELYDKGEIEKVKAHLRYSAKYYFGLTIPFIFGSIICSKELLRILSTEEISSNGWFIVPIIAIAYLFLGIYNLLNYILLITKKTKILAVVWIIAMPLNIILNILIIPYYGLIGAAITTALSYFIAMCVTAFFSLKELTFSIDIGFILKSVVSSSIMGVFLIMFQPIGLLQMLICIVLALVIYTISLIILRSFNKNEYDLAKNLFGKIISFK